jgi:hypothetical protein
MIISFFPLFNPDFHFCYSRPTTSNQQPTTQPTNPSNPCAQINNLQTPAANTTLFFHPTAPSSLQQSSKVHQ